MYRVEINHEMVMSWFARATLNLIINVCDVHDVKNIISKVVAHHSTENIKGDVRPVAQGRARHGGGGGGETTRRRVRREMEGPVPTQRMADHQPGMPHMRSIVDGWSAAVPEDTLPSQWNKLLLQVSQAGSNDSDLSLLGGAGSMGADATGQATSDLT